MSISLLCKLPVCTYVNWCRVMKLDFLFVFYLVCSQAALYQVVILAANSPVCANIGLSDLKKKDNTWLRTIFFIVWLHQRATKPLCRWNTYGDRKQWYNTC